VANPNPPETPSVIEAILRGRELAEQKREPDEKDKLELKSAREREEIHVLKETRTDRRANRALRFRYAKAVYRYLVWYSIGCLALVLLSGFKVLGFSIPEIAFTAIVGSTAVSAIGLVGFVVQGLFRAN
jgi:hypothetical protein